MYTWISGEASGIWIWTFYIAPSATDDFEYTDSTGRNAENSFPSDIVVPGWGSK